MAKEKPVKKVSSKNYLKRAAGEFFEKSMGVVVSSLSKTNIFEWMKEIAQVKEKKRRFTALMTLLIAGVVLIATGIATLLSQWIPKLRMGLSQIIIGVVLILAGLAYSKMR